MTTRDAAKISKRAGFLAAVFCLAPLTTHAADAVLNDDAAESATADAIRVAVVDFSSADGKAFTSCNVTLTPMHKAGGELSRYIAERLNAWPEYSVLDPAIVNRAIAKHKLARKGLNKPETLTRLADVTGVDAVVVGQTEGSSWKGKGHAGASLYASMQLVSTQTADVIWSIDGNLTDTRSRKNVVPDLACDLTERLYAQLQELNI